MKADQEAVRAFFDGWDLYKRVIEHDYMFHRAIHEHLRSALRDLKSVRLLDLGCGDASVMAATLDGLDVAAYTGVDLSPVAVELARKNLAEIPGSRHFHAGDMLAYLDAAPNASFNAVVAGYTVHHFTGPEITRFFAGVRRQLSAGGILLLYDVFRDREESRHENLSRNHNWRVANWDAMSPEDLAAVWDHVSTADHPKSSEELEAVARSESFDHGPRLLFEAPTGIHRLYAFR